MKYKIAGLLACAVALLLGLTAPLLDSEKSTRYHQHLEALPKRSDETDSGVFSTHLPLVVIDTGGVEIPGRAYFDEENNWARVVTTAEDGADRILAHMDIVDHEDTYNHAGDEPTISSQIEIHVRGRSSRHFDKHGYALRLVTESGENNPQRVLGMDAHHEWVLHGPFLDQTLMRNYMWYNIGGEIMDYAPNVRFCELILNGTYQGVYVMLENLTAGSDGARLPLSVSAKHNSFNGYLLQLNGGSETKRQLTNQFSFYAKRTRYPMEIVYPGANSITPEMATAISKDFSDFEKTLYSFDYNWEDWGYKRHIDVQSFVDYFLITELTCNSDVGSFSTYMAKGIDGRYRMYLWDMNSCCDNYQESAMDLHNFKSQHILWYQMLTKDEDFTEAIIQRYYQLRQSYFDPNYLCDYIDAVAAYLGPAVERNYEVWGYTFGEDYTLHDPPSRDLHSYEEALEQMKGFLRERIAWMDENIEILRQYSAESKVKKFNENAN